MNKQHYFKLTFLVIFLTLFSISGSLSAGQVYKWTDEEGVIHYSDSKPNNIESTKIKIKAGKARGSRNNAQNQAQTLDKTKSEQLAAQAQKLQDETYKRENDARCQTLRDNLTKFKESSRIKIEENGELRFLTPEEISSKTTEYNRILKEECS